MIVAIALILLFYQPKPVTAQRNNMTENRFEEGLELVKKLNGEGYERFRQNLEGTAPELVKLAIEFPYGNLLSRQGLDLKLRQIGTVAALTALGNAQPQLNFHIHGALNVGCTRTEIVELITQLSAYVGFPVAINAMNTAKEVFMERDAQGQTN